MFASWPAPCTSFSMDSVKPVDSSLVRDYNFQLKAQIDLTFPGDAPFSPNFLVSPMYTLRVVATGLTEGTVTSPQVLSAGTLDGFVLPSYTCIYPTLSISDIEVSSTNLNLAPI